MRSLIRFILFIVLELFAVGFFMGLNLSFVTWWEDKRFSVLSGGDFKELLGYSSLFSLLPVFLGALLCLMTGFLMPKKIFSAISTVVALLSGCLVIVLTLSAFNHNASFFSWADFKRMLLNDMFLPPFILSAITWVLLSRKLLRAPDSGSKRLME